MRLKYLLVGIGLGMVLSCTSDRQPATLINLAHLNHLYQEIVLDSLPAAIVHIYAEYPDYGHVEAPGEGIACVDDAARAAVVYMRHYQQTGEEKSLNRARKLLQFILDMQAPNGMFYNFIQADHTINTHRPNSRARPDWWTWRAVWAMGEAYPLFFQADSGFAAQLAVSVNRTLPKLDSILNKYPDQSEVEGFSLPDWLPHRGAADQVSELLLGLVPFYQSAPDSLLARRIRRLGEGLLRMQLGDSTQFPYGALLSWQNIWHAYGNSQADALLESGSLLHEPDFIESALIEVRFFYPYLMSRGYPQQMVFQKRDGIIDTISAERFPQIAYNIRPMVMASLRAFDSSGKEEFLQQAAHIANWLFGKNPAGELMYNPKTGRCFDGIESPHRINRNSGAESTIEALLTLLAVEEYSISKQIVHGFYQSTQ